MSDAIEQALEELRKAARRMALMGEVVAELRRQDEKWGEQHHRDGSGPGFGRDVLRDLLRFSDSRASSMADAARTRADHYAELRGGNALEWEQILTEEFFEAIEENDPQALRTELIQVAAVAMAWVYDIDSREPEEIDD